MARENMILLRGDVVTPEEVLEDGMIEIHDGTITSVSHSTPLVYDPNIKMVDCHDKIIMAGFIDVHTHGAIGLDFTDEDPSSMRRLSNFYYRHGVTIVLATLSSLPVKLMVLALRRVADFCRENGDNTNIFGVHLEGPFLNKSLRGGNAEEYIESPELDSWKKLLEAGGGYIRLMTLAPELPAIGRIIEDAVHNNVVISMGHSSASSEVTARVIDAGATQVSHLFNAMPVMHHREPGILAEALLSDKVDAQIIADGIHVDLKMVQLAMRTKSVDHILLITDSMCATNLPDGEYLSAGNAVKVDRGIPSLKNGTLAGSTLVFEKAVKMVAENIEVDFPSVSRMASLNAARSLRIQHHTGSIERGKVADLVVLDKQFNVCMTIHHGVIKYEAEIPGERRRT